MAARYTREGGRLDSRSPHQRWLESLRENNYLERSWIPVRVLGQGGQGVVGLYKWDSLVPKKYPYDKIAVKQAAWGHRRSGLTHEDQLLGLLKPTKSIHIVHKYTDVVPGIGSFRLEGVVDSGRVHRFILEYCEGGSLYDLFRKRQSKAIPLYFDEEEIWEIFHCLARGLLVMHHGSEDSTQPRWDNNEIVHLDIKYDNILIGSPLDDEEHEGWAPFKIADLGSGRLCPDTPSPQFHKSLTWAGTDDWSLPEQGRHANRRHIKRPWLLPLPNEFDPKYFPDLHANTKSGDLVYGTASNVWQVGLVVWCLMHNVKRADWDNTMVAYRWSVDASDLLEGGSATIGDKADQDAANGSRAPLRYSKALRTLVAECLIIQQNFRIKPAELVEKTGKWLKETREYNKMVATAAVLQETAEQAADTALPASTVSASPGTTVDVLSQLERSPGDEPPLPPSPAHTELGAQVDRRVEQDILLYRQRARWARNDRRLEAAAQALPNLVAAPGVVEQLAAINLEDNEVNAASPPIAPPANQYTIPCIIFIYTTTNWFGRRRTKTLRLRDVASSLSVRSIKETLVATLGCPIPASNMKLMNGRQCIPGALGVADLVANGFVIRVTDWRDDRANRPADVLYR